MDAVPEMTPTIDGTNRVIEIVFDQESPLGLWHMNCPTCPMHPLQDAVEAKRQQCVGGMSTNMQGAIPLHRCKHADASTEWTTQEVVCTWRAK